MGINPVIGEGKQWAGSPVTCASAIRTVSAGALITQASISTIVGKVWVGEDQIGSDINLTVGSVIWDALQTGDYIGDLMGGYNFLTVVPGSYFSTANTKYEIVFTITLTDGEDLLAVFENVTRKVPGA